MSEKDYKKLSEIALVAYFRARGIEVDNFEDIIRLFMYL